MIPGAVTLSYLYPGDVAGPFCDSLMRMACDPWAQEHIFSDTTGGGYIAAASGPLVASVRNMIVETFLDSTEGEWLMMIDSDHTFSSTAVRTLVEWADPLNAPVVGGLCFSGGRGVKIAPTMFSIGNDGNGGLALGTFEKWEPGAVVEVSATGASFLLVHRFLLEDMRKAYKDTAPLIWFGNGYGKGAQIGEDIFFCIRAKNVGAKIFVHTGVEAPHIKRWLIDSTDYAAYRAQVAELGEDAVAAAHQNKLLGLPPPAVGSKPLEAPINRQQRRALERKRVAA